MVNERRIGQMGNNPLLIVRIHRPTGRYKRISNMAALLTVKGFCQEYEVSRSTVYRLRDSGDVPHVKIGRATRIRSEDAQRWFASLSEHTAND